MSDVGGQLGREWLHLARSEPLSWFGRSSAGHDHVSDWGPQHIVSS